MTDVQTTDRGPSSLASKNPFRNLVADTNPNRSLSNNPFLDSNEIMSPDSATKAPATAPNSATSPTSMIDKTADIFVSPFAFHAGIHD